MRAAICDIGKFAFCPHSCQARAHWNLGVARHQRSPTPAFSDLSTRLESDGLFRVLATILTCCATIEHLEIQCPSEKVEPSEDNALLKTTPDSGTCFGSKL